jgi:uncharacterized repeat protein (TIGR02543 family)
MKTQSLLLIFIVSLAVCACENPLMTDILGSKTITFESNGGSYVPPQTLLKNEKISEPRSPVRGGYFFNDWYTDNSSFENRWDFNDIPEKNITLYANWDKAIFYNANDLGNYLISIFPYITNGAPGSTNLNPITIQLNFSSLDGIMDALNKAPNIYVVIDFSDSTITEIPDRAFDNYSSRGMLSGIIIPNSVTRISTEAFWGCNNLITINVDEKNINYSSDQGVLYDHEKTSLIIYPSGKTGAFTIPYGVTDIGDHAFYNCTGLTGIIISSNVTGIGNQAFSNCTNLTGVNIPNNVTNIGWEAFSYCIGLTDVTIGSGVTFVNADVFWGCTSLNAINVDSGNNEISSNDGVLYNNDKTILIKYPQDKQGNIFTIPNTVTDIGGNAFYNCTNLTGIIIPDSVTSIGNNAFSDCTNLTSITIPDNITNVESGAFNNTAWFNNKPDGVVYTGKAAYKYKGVMPANTNLTLSNGTVRITEGAFSNCTGLTSVNIPDSVTSIGYSAFSDCTGLTAINVNSGNSNYSSEQGVLYDKNKTSLIICPSKKTGVINIPNSVTGIESNAFSNCVGLTGIAIPDNVNYIGYSAFYGCTGLTGIIIPGNVTYIGDSTFYGCTGLTGITIPDNVTYIGYSAFYGCTGLTGITIPGNVTQIGYSAFSECTSLTSVTFQNTIASNNFDDYAFPGNLRDKFYASNKAIGTQGTYTRPRGGTEWTRQ